jgi:hypothetical protein
MPDEDWGSLEAHYVTTLREVKTEPVPEAIVSLAQKSYDGFTHPKDPALKLHAMELKFETPERAARFAVHMRNAGAHTVPPSSVTVVVDPARKRVDKLDEQGKPVTNEAGKTVRVPGPAVDPCKVAWLAGKRRGRKDLTSSTDA